MYILILLFSFAKISAQEPIRYSTKQGLPTNHIYDIQEDADGFMWFATNRGLVKYDGETFMTLTIKDGLPNNDTWSLELDYQGKLWYFSKSNYQGYIKNDSIYKFQTEDKKVNSPRQIYKSENRLWFAGNKIFTLKDTVFKGSSFYAKYTVKQFNDKIVDLPKTYNINRIKGNHIINPKTSELVIILNDKLLFYDIDFNLIEEKKHNLPDNIDYGYIQTAGLTYNQIGYMAFDKGLLFVDFKSKTSKYIDFTKISSVKNYNFIKIKGLKNEIQVSILNHLFIYNYELELIDQYEFTEQTSNIGSYKDSKGNIWLRSMTNGISLKPNTQTESNYSLKNKKVQKINKIDGDFYAGINNDGFYKLNRKTNQYEVFRRFNKANDEIYHIKNDTILKQALFIGGGGSARLKDQQLSLFEIKYIYQVVTHIIGHSFKDIITFNGFTYVVSSGSIFIKESESNNKAKIILSKQGIICSSIFKNKVYFAGSDGLHVLKKDSLQRTTVTNKLTKVSVNTMLATKNNLFVGTDGRGVYSYDDNKIVLIKNTDGLSIQRIIKKDEKLWIATNNGVHEITINDSDLENSKITNSFYDSDGLLQNNTNDIYIENNTLTAASDIGIAELNITNNIYKQKPKLYFKTKNDTLNYTNGARDNIAINYGLQDYNNQEYVNYQYRLLPQQKEWITTQTNILNFTNLPPDFYQLEVKATDQHLNHTVVRQYLEIQPSWWQTTLAKVGFGIVALLCFWLFINSIKKQIRKKEKEKLLQDKRVADLELQALRSQMNPHFVHNSLNAIQYFIQRNEVELSENYLSKFSQLIRLFFEYSRRQHISIKEEIELLTNYLEIEKLRFEEKLNYTISLDKEIDDEDQNIPSMLLQPIVENAVNHGLFHKKEKGTVNIDFIQVNNNAFKVIVKDDGIGVNKAKTIFKTSSKNYQSNSSAVLKERLDLLNKSNKWQIDYKIIDLSEIEKNQSGTSVTLVFTQNQN